MQLIQDRWHHILMDDVHIDTMTRAIKYYRIRLIKRRALY